MKLRQCVHCEKNRLRTRGLDVGGKESVDVGIDFEVRCAYNEVLDVGVVRLRLLPVMLFSALRK